MGMIVQVYRAADPFFGDCTNGGISSKFHTLTVVNVEGPFEPTPERPAVRLECHHQHCLRLVPVFEGSDKKWFQSGGNFAETSDSRFREACEKLSGQQWYGAVAIHDRTEG